jgi:amidohydrolase
MAFEDWARGRVGVAAPVRDHFDEMVDVRRALHAEPELSFAEHQTTSLVRERLGALGVPLLPCPTETGAVALIEGGRPGKTVLLRADIDALPVDEALDLPFRSRHEGRMHACGHDAHTAALLGVAAVLSAQAESLPGRYLLVFQPGEEILAGARALVDGGVLDGHGVAAVLGWHVASILPVGSVLVRSGVMFSGSLGFRVVFRGEGGHAAQGPRQDVVRAVGELACQLDTVIEGMAYEGMPCVCSAGMVSAGTASNVVPTSAMLEGTLRTFTADQRSQALERLRLTCEQVAEAFGVAMELDFTMQTAPVVNDGAVTEQLVTAGRRVLGPEGVAATGPLPFSDDVSELLTRVPGCYFLVGGQPGAEPGGMHHSPTFAIDEAAMGIAAVVMAESAVDVAGHSS